MYIDYKDFAGNLVVVARDQIEAIYYTEAYGGRWVMSLRSDGKLGIGNDDAEAIQNQLLMVEDDD